MYLGIFSGGNLDGSMEDGQIGKPRRGLAYHHMHSTTLADWICRLGDSQSGYVGCDMATYRGVMPSIHTNM